MGTAGRDPLVEAWRYHASIASSDLGTAETDRRHRGHAIVEQVVAEVKAGPQAPDQEL